MDGVLPVSLDYRVRPLPNQATAHKTTSQQQKKPQETENIYYLRGKMAQSIRYLLRVVLEMYPLKLGTTPSVVPRILMKVWFSVRKQKASITGQSDGW